MSRLFNSLRKAEQERKGRAESPQEDKAETSGLAGPPSELAAGDRSSKEEPKAPELLKEQLSILAVRLEASRAQLEAQIADARQVRKGWEEELETTRKRIQESSLETFSAATVRIKSELLREIETLSQSAIDRIEKSVEERMAAATHSLDEAVVTDLANSARACFGRALHEMTDRLRNDLGAMQRGFEEEASKELKKRADRVVESAAEFTRKQADDSLLGLREGLVATARDLIGDTEKQIGNAKVAIQGLAGELQKVIGRSRSESTKIIQEFRKSGARELKADLTKALRQEGDAALQRLQEETNELTRDALAQARAQCLEVQEACAAMHRQVGQAGLILKQWQNQVREDLEATLQNSLEAFGKQLTGVSLITLQQHRRLLALWLDDFQVRMRRAARALGASGADSHNTKPHHDK